MSQSQTQPSSLVTGGSGYLGRNLITFLVKKGWKVVAIARSQSALNTVSKLGATGILCDLSDPKCIDIMSNAMKSNNCKYCFHSAALMATWGVLEESFQTNQIGTRYVAAACEKSGIFRLIHVSTEAVLSCVNRPIINFDESVSYPTKSDLIVGNYGISKQYAEIEALAANNRNNSGLQVIIIRPRLIWGNDDTTILPLLIEKINNGSFSWINGGEYKTSLVHVDNVCYSMYLAATFNKNKNIGGEIYFVTDGKIVKFKDLVSDLFRCVPDNKFQKCITDGKFDLNKIGTMSFNMLYWIAYGLETILWCGKSSFCNKMFNKCCKCSDWFKPPIDRQELIIGGRICTVNDKKIRKELGYKEIISIEQGMNDLAKRNGKSDKEIKNIVWETCKE